MKKKVLAVLLGGCMVAGLVAGCGSKDDGQATDGGDGGEGGGGYHFEVVVKSFQSTYWQAAITGVDSKAEELGVTVNKTGPNAESDIADQVQMLNNAINQNPDGIATVSLSQRTARTQFLRLSRQRLTKRSRLYASIQACRMLRKDLSSLRSLQTMRLPEQLRLRICMK